MTDSIPPLPCDFIRQIEQDFSEEAAALLLALDNTEPIVSIRYNSHKCERYQVSPSANSKTDIPWCKEAYKFSERPFFAHDPLWHAGIYYVQEAASMALSYLQPLLPQHPIDALDLCAAPGGKSTLLLSILPENSTLVANEPIPKRAQILRENLLKWGCPNTIVTNNYPDQLAATGAQFDLITVDAPCSGEGLFRKTPEARLEWSLQAVEECALLQREILDAAWAMLRPGGMLVYCTCTFNRFEDEEQAQYLLKKYGATLVSLKTPLKEWHWIEGKDGLGWHFLPGITEGEGFYFVVLSKLQEEQEEKDITLRSKKGNQRRDNRKKTRIQLSEDADQWLLYREEKERGELVASPFSPEEIQWIPPQLFPKYQELDRSKVIRIIASGIPIGESRGKEIVPSPLLPYNLCCNASAFPRFDLEKEQALAYLAGDTLVPPCGLAKGFCLVYYKNVPLGFVKNIGTRCNNLYPKSYRLKHLPQ